MKELIPLKEACKRLTVSRRTLDRLIASGALPVVRVSPGRYAMDAGALDQYIDANTTQAAPHNPPLVPNLSSFWEVEERLRNRLRMLKKGKNPP